MIGEDDVAILAGVVNATALHLDGNNVSRPVIVDATSVRIEIDPTNVRQSCTHRSN
jgi:hypothetical protein